MKNPNDLNTIMQQEPKCQCCKSTMSVGFRDRYVPSYDDGGGLDAMEVVTERVEICTNPDCDYGINTAEHSSIRATYYDCDDDLPF